MRNTSVVIDKIYEYTSIYIYKYNIHIFIYMCGGVYIYTHIYKTYMCIYIYIKTSHELRIYTKRTANILGI